MNVEDVCQAAATLAVDLVNARPKLQDDTAADIAWQTLPQGMVGGSPFSNEVTRKMQKIRDGELQRIEPFPEALQRALERADRSHTTPN